VGELVPLSQINFLPDLMHVYFLLVAIEVFPSFAHVAPAFTSADEAASPNKLISESVSTKIINFLSTPK
jgi:hypothetical protein